MAGLQGEVDEMYKRLIINDFRLFHGGQLVLGKYVTVLAGRNATGKSTLLGMLGNSGELKKKDGSTYLKGAFRADFSELFKASEEFDPVGGDRFTVEAVTDIGDDSRKFRIAWQSDARGGTRTRFRLIPKGRTSDGKITEAKMRHPVLYLGLSRLFPIGEAQDDSIKPKKTRFFSDEDKEWFLSEYTKIMSIQEAVDGVSDYSLSGVGKHGIGIDTESFDYRANSSGMDNLGQILMAVLSFRALRERQGAGWYGGLLLIDEVDATLHPAAQARLLDLLVSEGRDYGLQTVFTTHSLSLLEAVAAKAEHNQPCEGPENNIELYYLTNANRRLDMLRNPSFMQVKADLHVRSFRGLRSRVGVFTEDEEAKWFLGGLLSDDDIRHDVDLIDSSCSCDQLIHLYKCDFSYLRDRIVAFDGDVEDKRIEGIPERLRKAGGNIVRLPGGKRPESVIYDFLIGCDSDHDVWVEGQPHGITWDVISDNGPDSAEYSRECSERNRYKAWLSDYRDAFDSMRVMELWKRDNSQLVEGFLEDFKKAHEAVTKNALAT